MERRAALGSLLTIRRRRVFLAQIQVSHRQAELVRAEARLDEQQRKVAALQAALTARRGHLAARLADGMVGSEVQAIAAQLAWLKADWQHSEKDLGLAGKARDQAARQVDQARRRVQLLEERSRQLERLDERARRLVERRQAERLETRASERYAAERHARART